MQQDKFLISGAGGQAASRLEINDFIKDKKQLSLYIQALDAMFKEKDDPRLSWFSVGGIHGLPYVEWNQSPPPLDPQGNPGPFCVHATPLFAPWHRPYVALLEQIIGTHAASIAEKYTADTALWKSAAANLRQPYWDWAINPVPPDVIISDEKVKILHAPMGEEVEVENPFLRYRFRSDSERQSFHESFKDWPTTLRYPTGKGKDATSDVVQLKLELAKYKSGDNSLKSQARELFWLDDWNQFSTTRDHPDRIHNSLEGVHNAVHNVVGGHSPAPEQVEGHMADISYAGFDPIFFLHHCQVDHLLSLWSYIHTLWITGPDASKDLTPFWKTQSNYWSSTDIQTESSLHYTYPELVGGPTPAEVALKVIKLYGGATFEPGPVESLKSLHPSPQSNSITQWSARVRSKQFEVGGSFSVLIFLGNVPENSSEWHTSPTYVGSFHAFVNRTPEACANCQTQEDVYISGVVHLNEAITNTNDNQASLHPDYVVPRLTKGLSWRVRKTNGTVVDLQGIPSLEVVVTATPLTLSPGALFPTVGKPQLYHEITRGTPGGSCAT
ncbi:hypothetical protein JB92DRAFT_124714 [Gautieria morchelliformis]|nr:hypothetical protein JB92DRAFT_124714 [Gautieria morchelliformis]